MAHLEHYWPERSCPRPQVVRFISRPSGNRSIRLVLACARSTRDLRSSRKSDAVGVCSPRILGPARGDRSKRSSLVCSAQGRSGSFDAAIGIVRETAEYVVRFCSDLYQVVRSNSLARISSLFALSVALVTALLNTWLTGYLHKNVLPSVASEVSILLEREVNIGKIHWISPIGLLGCAPLASIGPVQVGPGPIEKTSATVPTVRAGLSLAQSILQRKFVLWINLHNPDVDLVQGSNFSWFGHPVDTTPSSKDFLPGLTKRAGGAENTAHENSSSSRRSSSHTRWSSSDHNQCDSSVQDRRKSHYYSSTSEVPSVKPQRRHWRDSHSHSDSSLHYLGKSIGWTEDRVNPIFLEEFEDYNSSENALITQGVGGYHLAGSGPRLQVFGPDASLGFKSFIGEDNFANTIDSGVPAEAGSGSSKTDPKKPDSSRRSRHRRHHRLRDRRETCHSRQRAPIPSRSAADTREVAPALSDKHENKVEEGAIEHQPCDLLEEELAEKDEAAEKNREPEKDEEADTSLVPPEMESFEQPSDNVEEALPSSKPVEIKDSTMEDSAPPLPPVEKEKTIPKESKSVNVEVILPVRDMRNPKSLPGSFPSEQLSRSRDVTDEQVQQWIAAVWRQITRNIKPPEVAVGKLSIYKGVLFAHMTGETIPRQMVDVNGHIRLGDEYHTLKADVKAKAHSRLTESLKCTMLSPAAQHHLRFVTPGVTGGYDHVFPGDITYERVQEKKHAADDTEVPDILSSLSSEPLANSPSMQSSISNALDEAKGASKGGPGGFSSLSMSPPFQGVLWSVDDRGTSVKGSPKKVKIPNSGAPRKLGERQPMQGQPTVDVSEMLRSDRLPDLDLKVFGKDLHGPLIDRILEIPLDIHEGRANGYIQIRAFDTESWLFPKIDGDIKCRNVDFHFWDCPDHLNKCDFDLIFEDNRLYFHNAVGNFGSVPLTVTDGIQLKEEDRAGDMDLDPETGKYRIVATVPPVEANSIRASLGVRPLPHPVVGAVKGTLYCSGPLEEPVFSGVAEVLRPSDAAIDAMENSHAKEAILGNLQAVAAFDKVAFTSGSAVFTLDTSTDIFTLHDSVALVAGGGKLTGGGQMWIAPVAEQDPQAIAMRIEGYGIATKEVMENYLPETVELPEVLDPGSTNVKATMRGSHASPVINIQWEAPSMNASGTAELCRSYWKATALAPTFDVAGTLHTKFPDFQLTKTAYNQSEMNALTTPMIVGVDTDVSMKGCDVMPLVSNTSAVDRVASGQAVRLKINGRGQVSACRKETNEDSSEAAFSGDISLQGLRVNQLNLAKQLGGSLDFSQSGFQLLARGQRADELLDVKFMLPQAMRMDGAGFAQASSTETSEQDTFLENEEPGKRTPGEGSTFAKRDKGGYFSLRQGKLLISTEVSNLLDRMKIGIRGLKLDDLELASLRGDLQDVSLDLNFGSREGRGELNMSSPRYSGLMGKYLTGGFRWEKDVVRLEKMILQQQRSRYEVEGEYSVPANLALPKSIPALAQGPTAVSAKPRGLDDAPNGQQPIGRWRIQVTVPNADVEEIIPAARLLSRATSMSLMNYDEAKIAFLDGLKDAGISSGKMGEDLKQLIMPEIDLYKDSAEGVTSGGGLPGLQSLRGKWQGTVQAWGGGEGASTLNIKVKGDSWRWGEYELDKAVAIGSYHSAEGIHLDELSLGTGEAHLLIRGDLLGPKQDATMVLNDFPAALLSPIYRAVPALQNAVPAVTERVSLSPFVDSWERTFKALGINLGKEDTPMQRLAKGSPVNGLLYVQGALGGSANVPEGIVNVQLYDGALGPTRLSGAKAEFTLNQQQEIQFNLSANPDDSSGSVKVVGTLPFLQENGMRGNMDVNVEVVDGGMMLVSALLPDFRWDSGMADIALSASGDISDPEIKGRATIARATMHSPNLKYPLKNVHGSMTIEDGTVSVENFDARAGNHGHIHAKGFLPMEVKTPQDCEGLFSVEVEGLELKLNSTYSGRLDSSLLLTKSLKEPVVSGAIELSRGTMQLQFGALGSSEDKESGSLADLHSGAFADGQTLGLGPGVTKVYQPPEVVESPLKGVQLQNLELILGSELRFQVPLMVNLAISGSVEVSGGFEPSTMVPSGTIQIDGGMVNLLATQLRMARGDQPGRITFIPEQGLDPNVDITFTSAAEGFRATCKGRASTWQENLIVTDGTDEVRLSQAAKMFQKRLDDVLVAENGQLAFMNLAASTMATMTPRLDTQGQIGAARWRLVSAPNIPDLLTNANRLDLHNIVSSLITGTEVEVQFGPTLQAVVTHKMRGADNGTQWNLSLNLTDKFRLSATVANSPPTTRTIILEYRSEGRPRLL